MIDREYSPLLSMVCFATILSFLIAAFSAIFGGSIAFYFNKSFSYLFIATIVIWLSELVPKDILRSVDSQRNFKVFIILLLLFSSFILASCLNRGEYHRKKYYERVISFIEDEANEDTENRAYELIEEYDNSCYLGADCSEGD